MGKLTIATWGSIAAALAGCATYSPPPGAATATLSIRNSTLVEGQQAQMFHRGTDGSRRVVMGDGVLYAYDVPHPIEAGKRAFIEVEMRQDEGISQFYCLNWFSFTPEAGRAYEVLPQHRVTSCGVQVRDVATGAAPPDLRLEADPAGR